jgi:hypothetical protein
MKLAAQALCDEDIPVPRYFRHPYGLWGWRPTPSLSNENKEHSTHAGISGPAGQGSRPLPTLPCLRSPKWSGPLRVSLSETHSGRWRLGDQAWIRLRSDQNPHHREQGFTSYPAERTTGWCRRGCDQNPHHREQGFTSYPAQRVAG